jgi:lipopolysaccharide/colanic/teichoic acid biosynthesis glycosyltransferase
LGSISVVRTVSEEHSSWQIVGTCERAVAVGLFALSLPITITSAIAVGLLSRRTPLIAHRRVGRGGTTLWTLKLRTMWGAGADTSGSAGWVEYISDEVGPERKLEKDPRVRGGFAQFLRRHSIDELPQLWHVITGEMSLVGPRPLTESELQKYYGAQAAEVLQLKPGLAGLWQISGRNRLSYDDRRRLDLHFVRHRSVGMYASILLRTIPEVLFGQNSW